MRSLKDVGKLLVRKKVVIPNFKIRRAFAQGSTSGFLFWVMGGSALFYNFVFCYNARVLFGVKSLELIYSSYVHKFKLVGKSVF